jgi:hypothetical protein
MCPSLSGYWEVDECLRREIHSNLTINGQELQEISKQAGNQRDSKIGELGL